ncbi:MAG: response regulator [Bdellovibrionales bacterium]|nr:response regulator [Bdellovibrionales bacterium]
MSNQVKKWILVVDDEPEIVDIVLKLLEMNFSDIAKFVSARDGVDASNRLNFQAFDLIITDLKMPKRDGNAFVDSVKNNPLNQNAPIIVLSANPDYAHKDKYPDLKILEKPIDTGALIALVRQELKLGKTDQRLEAGLLNGFVSGFAAFFKDVLNLTLNQEPPALKSAFQDILEPSFYFIRVQSGKVSTSFVFGFEKETLLKMAKKVTPEDHEVNLGKALEVCGSLILQHAIKATSAKDLHVVGRKPVIDSSQTEVKEEVTLAKREKGIIIPLSSEVGKVRIYILW